MFRLWLQIRIRVAWIKRNRHPSIWNSSQLSPVVPQEKLQIPSNNNEPSAGGSAILSLLRLLVLQNKSLAVHRPQPLPPRHCKCSTKQSRCSWSQSVESHFFCSWTSCSDEASVARYSLLLTAGIPRSSRMDDHQLAIITANKCKGIRGGQHCANDHQGCRQIPQSKNLFVWSHYVDHLQQQVSLSSPRADEKIRETARMCGGLNIKWKPHHERKWLK